MDITIDKPKSTYLERKEEIKQRLNEFSNVKTGLSKVIFLSL